MPTPYVVARVIDVSQEPSKAKYNKAPVYLEVIHGIYKAPKPTRTQLIPLPLKSDGKRFEAASVGRAAVFSNKVDAHATAVLSGVGLKSGHYVSVHVPSHGGDVYCSLTPQGTVTLNTAPSTLRLDLTTFGEVKTGKHLHFEAVSLRASKFIARHSFIGHRIRLDTSRQILTSAEIEGDWVELVTDVWSHSGVMTAKKLVLFIQTILNTGRVNTDILHFFSEAAINNQGHIESSQGISGKVSQITQTSTAILLTRGRLALEALLFENAGLIAGEDVCLSGAFHNQASGQCVGMQALRFSAPSVHNLGSIMTMHGDLTLHTQTLHNAGLLKTPHVLHLHLMTGTNVGLLQAKRLELKSTGLVENLRTIRVNDLHVESLDVVRNAIEGEIIAPDMRLHALTLENRGTIKAQASFVGILKKTFLNAYGARIEGHSLKCMALEFKNRGFLSGDTVLLPCQRMHNLSSGRMECRRFRGTASYVYNAGRFTVDTIGILDCAYVLDNRIHLQAQSFWIDSGRLYNTGVVSASKAMISVQTRVENRGVLSVKHLQIKADVLNNIGEITGHTLYFQTETFINTGTLVSEGDIEIHADIFSHRGRIKAKGKVIIHAMEIESLGQIEAEGDIEIHYGGRHWNVSDTLKTPQNVRFFWPDGGVVNQAFQVLGGLHYELSPQAKTPLHFLINQKTVGDFSIRSPTQVMIGSDTHPVQLEGCKINIRAQSIDICGRLLSKETHLSSNTTLTIGRLHIPSAIMSTGNIVLHANICTLHAAELYGFSHLKIHASLDNISSRIIIAKDVHFEGISAHRLLTQYRDLGGKIAPHCNMDAMIAYKTLHGREEALTPPAYVEVGGTLSAPHPMSIFGSQIHCSAFTGPTPEMDTFRPYQQWVAHGYFGNPKRKTWWRHDPGIWLEPPHIGQFSCTAPLKTHQTLLKIFGTLTAGSIELHDIQQGSIGVTSSLALPAPKPFRSRIPLTEYQTPSVLFEVTEIGMYPSVYKPLLPYPLGPFGPRLVVTSNGLRLDVHHRRCLFSPLQEHTLVVKALMEVLGRGFIEPTHSTLKMLQDNAKDATLTCITHPMVVYEEIEFIHASQHTEQVLIPVLCLPKNLDNPRYRDYAGGLFSLGKILIQGTPSSELHITGHIDAEGPVVLSTFQHVTHTKRMTKTTERVSDIMTQTSAIKRRTRHFEREIEVWRAEPGNTVRGSGILYEDIAHLQAAGLTLTVGREGIRTHNVHGIEQRALIETHLIQESNRQRGLIGGTQLLTHEITLSLVPTIIESQGPVQLHSHIGYYDNLQVNGHAGNDYVFANRLTLGALPRRLVMEASARAAEKREAHRTAKRRQRQADFRFIVSLPAAYYAGNFIGGWAKGTGMTAVKVVALKGVAMGATGALIREQNIFENAAEGALFSLLGCGVECALPSIVPEVVKAAIHGIASGALHTVLHEGNLLENMITSAIVNTVAATLIPDAGDEVEEMTRTMARAMVQAGMSTLMANGTERSLAVHLAAAGMGVIGARSGVARDRQQPTTQTYIDTPSQQSRTPSKPNSHRSPFRLTSPWEGRFAPSFDPSALGHRKGNKQSAHLSSSHSEESYNRRALSYLDNMLVSPAHADIPRTAGAPRTGLGTGAQTLIMQNLPLLTLPGIDVSVTKPMPKSAAPKARNPNKTTVLRTGLMPDRSIMGPMALENTNTAPHDTFTPMLRSVRTSSLRELASRKTPQFGNNTDLRKLTTSYQQAGTKHSHDVLFKEKPTLIQRRDALLRAQRGEYYIPESAEATLVVSATSDFGKNIVLGVVEVIPPLYRTARDMVLSGQTIVPILGPMVGAAMRAFAPQARDAAQARHKSRINRMGQLTTKIVNAGPSGILRKGKELIYRDLADRYNRFEAAYTASNYWEAGKPLSAVLDAAMMGSISIGFLRTAPIVLTKITSTSAKVWPLWEAATAGIDTRMSLFSTRFSSAAEQFSEVMLVDRVGRVTEHTRLGMGRVSEELIVCHHLSKKPEEMLIMFKSMQSHGGTVSQERLHSLVKGQYYLAGHEGSVAARSIRNKRFSQTAWQTFRSNQQERIRITGSRSIREFELEDQLATKLYDEIRNSTHDIQKIAKNINIPEFQMRRIKEHVFYNTHQLDHGLGISRFHPDFEIATAWKRLEAGTHIESDLQILRHEHFESRFEGIFKTDYKTAHDAANRAGYVSGLEEQLNIGARNGFIHRDQ